MLVIDFSQKIYYFSVVGNANADTIRFIVPFADIYDPNVHTIDLIASNEEEYELTLSETDGRYLHFDWVVPPSATESATIKLQIMLHNEDDSFVAQTPVVKMYLENNIETDEDCLC